MYSTFGTVQESPSSDASSRADLELEDAADRRKMQPCAVVNHHLKPDSDLPLSGVVILLNRLLDNHLLIDPVQAIAPGRSPEHYRLRKAFQGAAIHGMISQPNKDTIFLITACLSSSERDVETARQFVTVGRRRNVPFAFVNLICDWQNHAVRLQAEHRLPGKTTKTKLTSVDILKKLVEQNRLLSTKR